MSAATINNTFTGGLNTDAHRPYVPKNAYSLAKNAVDQTLDHYGFGIANERGTKLAIEFKGSIKGWSFIEDIDQTLFFVWNNQSELHLYDHTTNTSKFVASDKEFSCNWGFNKCEFLYAEFKRFNACNELHAYWSSDCVFHVININEMLNPKRKAAVKAFKSCSYFDVFTATCAPNISAFASPNSGATLEGGNVRFAIKLRDADYNESNVFHLSSVVNLETEDNVAGQVSLSSAKLRVDGLDPRWKEVIVYVIHVTGGNRVVRKMEARGFSDRGFAFEYYGQQGEIVNEAEILLKNKAFIRGQDLIQKNGRMFFYNIKNEKNLNYQKWANQAVVRGVEYEVTLEDQARYHFPTLMRGEVYALAVRWNFLDGTRSDAFHLPACTTAGASPDEEPGTDPVRYCTSNNGQCLPCISCGFLCDECTPDTTNNTSFGLTATGSVGGSSNTPDPGAPDTYNPINIGDFNTDGEFQRLRNPSEREDLQGQSDNLEATFQTNVDAISTSEDSIVTAGECEACSKTCQCDGDSGTKTCTERDDQGNVISITTCIMEAPEEDCDCSVLPDQLSEDIDNVSNFYQGPTDVLSGMGKDDPLPPSDSTNSFREAASKLVRDAVTEREYIKRVRPKLGPNANDNPGTEGPGPEDPGPVLTIGTITFNPQGSGINTLITPIVDQNPVSSRGDNWTDGAGNPLVESSIRELREFELEKYQSVVPYPDDVDCEGNRFYPEGNVCHYQIPWTSDLPHFRSTQNGVVNKYQPENYEFGNTTIRLIGLRISNLHIPTDDELPKPLCRENPFSIVYVKRTDENRRVFAKGWMSGMFRGEANGTQYLYPRHGVNSYETVDRFIAAGGDGTSRMGSPYDGPAYTFHSPDTDADRSYLPVTTLRSEGILRGSGWRHGLVSKGKEPVDNQWAGTRKDNLGARVSNNINHLVSTGTDVDIDSITYAPGNTVVGTPPGADFPLMNRYRESSVYVTTSAPVQGAGRDRSFTGDVLNHYGPTFANAPYVAIYRNIPDQYGSVQSLQYIDLGLHATRVHANGRFALDGICGDSWIGPYAKRRTSYVSNKKGDMFNPPAKPGSPCRERSWCESADDMIFEYMGIDHYPTKLPKSGDIHDPKNYAGTHTIAGNCGPFGRSRPYVEALQTNVSESDFYYPGTLKSLVTTIVESNINPFLLETGPGPQIENGQVYYPKLKDLYLDSDAPDKHPWEESYLNRFYKALEQPSKKQLTTKALIRSVLNLALPLLGLSEFADMESVLDTVATLTVYPLMSAIWILMVNTLFNDKRLNQLLQIGDCRRDEEGGDLDDVIEQWEDAYTRFNMDYAQVNDFEITPAFPLPYNTCKCDACTKYQTNNQVYHSNKQNLDTEIDAYRNVKLNNYLELPAHGGRLQKLFIQGNGLFAHMSDGIFPLQLNEPQFPQGVAFQMAGTGELIAEPQLILEGIQEGFLGTRSPNAAINTPFGYFFIDDEARKIYRFNGNPEEITNYGMYNFFKKHLAFCELDSCYDEKIPTGVSYTMGWDPRFNRLLITKNPKPNQPDKFTLSYNPIGAVQAGGGARGKWVSFHDYIPDGYLWTRNDLYSIQAGQGKVWIHHVGKHGNFYDQQFPFIVEATATHDGGTPFAYHSSILDTDTIDGTKRDFDKTFNKLVVYNSTQSSGTREVLIDGDNFDNKDQRSRSKFKTKIVRFTKQHRLWKFSDLQDLVDPECTNPEIVTQAECEVTTTINDSIIDPTVTNKQEFKNRVIEDQWLSYRMEYTEQEMDLLLKSLKTNITAVE